MLTPAEDAVPASLRFGLRKRAATSNHDIDRLCADLGIEHRLTPPMHHQPDRMVGASNGQIEDVLQRHHSNSGGDVEQTSLCYDRHYNGQLPQTVLKGRVHVNALRDWPRQKPDLFKKRLYDQFGCYAQLMAKTISISNRRRLILALAGCSPPATA